MRGRSICERYRKVILGSNTNPIRRHNLHRPSLHNGTDILTCFPSTTHFCLVLGADSPCADWPCACLLYTSDAADDLLCVDLGGRRIIKKKKKERETVTPNL
eukprot:TRINITY_DN3479_c0_g1_i6.p1 TRINITY_DN3479_c0_g1~~TRINITY_DN3479_c0_g1_i6.p1  ORF type:complete len:102 (-),score=11.24 TRINITY_DN3479_c0_g1_i6:77-382(-)